MRPRLTFADLIAPTSIGSFFDDHWERRVLHVGRNRAGYFDDVLSPDDLEAPLQSSQTPAAFVNVARDGKTVPVSEWTRWTDSHVGESVRVVEPRQLFRLLGEGATVVLNRAHRSIPRLTAFCRRLSAELGMHARANVYLTPPSAQGFAPHYDTHDLLVLQIAGRKRWRLHGAPVELPTQAQPFRVGGGALPGPEQEVDMSEGDVLYIPRGVVHDAAAASGTSIHVALGLQAHLWFELMDDLAAQMQADPGLRRALPQNYSTPDSIAEGKRRFTVRLRSIVDSLDLDGLLAARQRREAEQDHVPLLADWLSAERLTLDSVLQRRGQAAVVSERRTGSISVRVGPRLITVPAFLEPALELFLQDRPFAVRDLRGLLSDSQRIMLAARFVRVGAWTPQA